MLAVNAYDEVDGANVMDVAADAVVEKDADVVKDAVVAKDAVAGVNVMDVAADAVVAKELEITLLAQLLVPNTDPVTPPEVNDNDPVMSTLPMTCNSVGALLERISDPVICWVPINTLDPVVAKVDMPVVARTSTWLD